VPRAYAHIVDFLFFISYNIIGSALKETEIKIKKVMLIQYMYEIRKGQAYRHQHSFD
jgi:hypothetical protein